MIDATGGKGAFVAIGLALMAHSVAADAPVVQTPSPVIYLADNLDEADQLGWCIDTLGRGFGETLQAHSCKPQGGDVQFALEAAPGLIRSVAFPDHCMEVLSDADATFGLMPCAPDDPQQHFTYNATTQAISPANDAELCVSVGADSRSAGPFMSRDLLLTRCIDTDPIYRSWVIADE
ncbi:ricin-type beta-trefoil lectin domain protein [Gymnodinialimonas sp. 2305UL16-5]|uniref:ricin-type beta-trefoil lectin domain protein n=1 Tax=Gymnodinialimonas mytili TaxID=3126503 RepID=UPI0030B04C1C